MKYISPRDRLFEFSGYHRGVAEEFEKDLTTYLNNANSRVSPSIKLVGDEIIKNFPNIIEAQHIGNRAYNIEGDIMLITSSVAVNLEIKLSDSFGKGTLANVSQKLFSAINPAIIGYQEFHNTYAYNGTTVKQYFWNLVGTTIGKTIRSNTEYQTYLRNLRDSGSSVVKEIVDLTNKIKLEYNVYLINMLKNTPEYLYKLTFLVRLLKDGIHTYSEIKHEMEDFKSIEEYKTRSKYYVVYVYNASTNVSCQIVDYSKALDTVHTIEAMGQSIVFYNVDKQIILRFSTHWKNICQGGATPCFNIFHGNVSVEDLVI